jgi:hypothetical protein
VLPHTPSRTHGGEVSATVIRAYLAAFDRLRATEGQHDPWWCRLGTSRLRPGTKRQLLRQTADVPESTALLVGACIRLFSATCARPKGKVLPHRNLRFPKSGRSGRQK